MWSKKKRFLAYVRNLETPFPLLRYRTYLAWPLPSPFVRTYHVDDPIRRMWNMGPFQISK